MSSKGHAIIKENNGVYELNIITRLKTKVNNKSKESIANVNSEYIDFIRFFLEQFKEIEIKEAEKDEEDVVFELEDYMDLNKIKFDNGNCFYDKDDKVTIVYQNKTGKDISRVTDFIVTYQTNKPVKIGRLKKSEKGYRFSPENLKLDKELNNIFFIHNMVSRFYLKLKNNVDDSVPINKISGNISTLLIKRYLESILDLNKYEISNPNVYIDSCNTECDLLILEKDKIDRELINFNIYNRECVVAVVEVKARGYFGSGSDNEKKFKNIDSIINSISKVKKQIKYLFISLLESKECKKELEEHILENENIDSKVMALRMTITNRENIDGEINDTEGKNNSEINKEIVNFINKK